MVMVFGGYYGCWWVVRIVANEKIGVQHYIIVCSGTCCSWDMCLHILLRISILCCIILVF